MEIKSIFGVTTFLQYCNTTKFSMPTEKDTIFFLYVQLALLSLFNA